MENQEKVLLEETKVDKSAYIALGDYYEEKGQIKKAVQARVKAGISKVIYRLIRKKDKEIIDESKALAVVTSTLFRLKPISDYEIRMFELRYCDVGVVTSPTQDALLQVEIIDGNPFVGDVCIHDLIKEAGKPERSSRWYLSRIEAKNYHNRIKDLAISKGLNKLQARGAAEYVGRNLNKIIANSDL